MIVGIDEAGRGPAIGPLVVCGVQANEKQIVEFEKLGITDSKLLSPKKRQELEKHIRNILGETHIHLVILSAQDIDARFANKKNLNDLEADATANILQKLKGKKIFVDCPSVNTQEYTKQLEQLSGVTGIHAEHKADLHYTIVGAASIIAKVKRDFLIEELKKEIGIDFGTGYPADPKTQAFLQTHFDKCEHIRKSWESVKRLKDSKKQTSLDSWSSG